MHSARVRKRVWSNVQPSLCPTVPCSPVSMLTCAFISACCITSHFPWLLVVLQTWLKEVKIGFNVSCIVSECAVESRLSELHLTETRVNWNACQALRFPELPVARHLWASRRQFAVKSWRVRTSGKLTCVRFLQCSFKISFNSDSKQSRLNENVL
jgi:hypothetical protein